MTIEALQYWSAWLFIGLMMTAFIWIGWIPAVDKAEFTHKGWFGICPVYINFEGDDDVTAVERSLLFYPLFWLSTEIYIFWIMVMSMRNPNYEPSRPFLVTGEL